MKKISILKEKSFRRVSAYPKLQQKLEKIGFSCYFEQGAGMKSAFYDKDFQEEGWVMENRESILRNSDILLSIAPLDADDLSKIKPKTTVIGQYEPFNNPEVLQMLKSFPINVISMDMIPRSTIAQSMDVLSSMASLSGYKAVLKALELYGKMMPLMMTAAGTIKPAKVMILGAGVAGLQAIATAKRLGAVVEAFDTRSAAKEEVLSLGAKFIEIEGAKEDTSAGGYAVQQSEEFLERQRMHVADRAAQSDIIITTAQVRGQKAPLLIPEKTLLRIRPGAVLVDLASSTGGNVAHSKDNEIVEFNGVNIIGNSILADDLPEIASELYGNNIYNLLKYITIDGEIKSKEGNEILESALIQSTNQ